MVSEVLAEGSRGRMSFCNLSIAIYHVSPLKEPRSCNTKHGILVRVSSHAPVYVFPKDAPVIAFYIASHLLSRRRRTPPPPTPWADSKVKVHAIVVIRES